jgi:hypothetical protein
LRESSLGGFVYVVFWIAEGMNVLLYVSETGGPLSERLDWYRFFGVQASRITVEPDKDLKPEQQAEVQRTMQDKVLESAQYPQINFRSTSIERTGADS